MNRLKGMFDIHEDAAYYAQIKQAIERLAHVHHIDRIDTPILESTELFHRGMGADTDVVNKETYTFKDRADRSVTLRPEGTAGVVRSYIEDKLYAAQDAVKKLYYDGPMFRYERPQKGRFRQFYSFGVEVFGDQSAVLDADVMKIAYDLMGALTLDSTLEINQLSVASKARYSAALKAHLEPSIQDFCSDCQTRLTTNPLRILDCKVDTEQAAFKSAPLPLDYLDATEKAYFQDVQDALSALEIPFTVNPWLVRGLDYYTGTVFELKVSTNILGRQNTVAGGGRYDGLVEELGGPSKGAIGFAFGLERLVLALKSAAITPPIRPLDMYVMVLDDQVKLAALTLVNELRHLGFKAELAYHGGPLKKQFKAVSGSHATLAVLYGPDEVKGGYLTVKDQTTNVTTTVPRTDLKNFHSLLKERAK